MEGTDGITTLRINSKLGIFLVSGMAPWPRDPDQDPNRNPSPPHPTWVVDVSDFSDVSPLHEVHVIYTHVPDCPPLFSSSVFLGPVTQRWWFTLFGEWGRLLCTLVLYGTYRLHDKGMKFAGAGGTYHYGQCFCCTSSYSSEHLSPKFLGNEGANTPWTRGPRLTIF